jgi:hypothetical protein
MWKKANNVVEVDGFVFLEESDNVSLTARLYEVLKIPRLGIIYFKFGFNLSYSEH